MTRPIRRLMRDTINRVEDVRETLVWFEGGLKLLAENIAREIRVATGRRGTRVYAQGPSKDYQVNQVCFTVHLEGDLDARGTQEERRIDIDLSSVRQAKEDIRTWVERFAALSRDMELTSMQPAVSLGGRNRRGR